MAPEIDQVTYRDTARVLEVAAERLLNSAFDTCAQNFLYFNYAPGPTDTLGMLRSRGPMAPNEWVLVGSTLVFDPAPPPPVYVPRVGPHLDPNATYTFIAFATFTLHLRTEERLCFITTTDLRLHRVPFDY